MCSEAEWQSLASLQEVLPAVPAAKAKKTKGEKEEEKELDLPEYELPDPWMHSQALWEYLRDDEVGKKKARLRKKTKVVAEPSSIAAMDGDEAVLKLLKRRAELDAEPASEARLFYVWKLREGQWSGQGLGLSFDCYAASVLPATTAADIVDCVPKLKKSWSFSISLYGDAGARVLAKAWIDRHFFFLRSWMEAGCNDDRTFSQELVDSYREPMASGSDGQLAARIVQIRAIVP